VNVLLPLPIVLPLLAAALCILVGGSRTAQRVIGLTTLTALVPIAIAILVRVDDDGVVVAQAGDWPAPIGITLVADRLSAIMLVTATVVLLAVLLYAIGQPGVERNHVGFQSVYMVLAAGVSAAFLTGDLFNLFVAIEMMLTASYVLITLGGRLEQVRSGMTYVVISLVASVLFLVALAFTYASTGTMNMADLGSHIAELPDGVRAALAGLLLVVFGIKAALFPLYFWLPDSYPTAPSAVTAIFAGLLTKVGIYAILRTQTLLFPPDSRPATLILIAAGATMVVGVLGAIAQEDIRRIFSFYIVSQIGYIIMGLGLFTVAGLAGAVYAIIHHIVVKTTLFLVGGLIEHTGGSSRLSRLGGMVAAAPIVAVLFLLPALSLAGIPPFSGFAAKFGLFDATAQEGQWTILAVAVLVSLLTLFSIFKIWIAVFWAPREAPAEPAVTATPVPAMAGPSPMGSHDGRSGQQTAETATPVQLAEETAALTDGPRIPRLMLVPTAVLAVLTLAIGVAAGPLYELSERAAAELLDPTAYRTAVLGP
jgi:multicomponent Na+:H+ antiporter subunit D